MQIGKVAAGGDHTIFLDRDTNTMISCGLNNFGQLGLQNKDLEDREIRTPVEVEYARKLAFIDVKCGSKHSLAMSKYGEVFTTGCNKEG